MARGINKAILVGNLGQDPELNHTGDGTPVVNLRVATNESYTSSDGEFVEQTEWHDVVAWEGLAEVIDEYLSKGSRVYIEGPLQTDEWEDRDGNKRYDKEIKALQLVMLDGQSSNGQAATNGQAKKAAAGESEGGETFEPDDELPF